MAYSAFTLTLVSMDSELHRDVHTAQRQITTQIPTEFCVLVIGLGLCQCKCIHTASE